MRVFGAIELGGTKIRVGLGHEDGTLVQSETFPTAAPQQGFERIRAFFQAGPEVEAIGVGSFGPIGVDTEQADWGRMLATPKPGWSGFNLIEALAPLGRPVRLQTDVAVAGMGEFSHGALRSVACGLYLTVGTGIGGALLLNGQVMNGAAHAEMGHIVLHRAEHDEAPSTCPYHQHCAEGLASGPAIKQRFGHSLSAVDATSSERSLIADYLGQLLAALTLALAPHRIIIGGGVAKTPDLLPETQRRLLAHLNGYGLYPQLNDPEFIASPLLQDDAGLIGALLLAQG